MAYVPSPADISAAKDSQDAKFITRESAWNLVLEKVGLMRDGCHTGNYLTRTADKGDISVGARIQGQCGSYQYNNLSGQLDAAVASYVIANEEYLLAKKTYNDLLAPGLAQDTAVLSASASAAEKTKQTKYIFLGLFILILIGLSAFFIIKKTFGTKTIVFSAIGLALAAYLLLFGIGKKS